eukprot:1466841-Rhodomonas_salina.1
MRCGVFRLLRPGCRRVLGSQPVTVRVDVGRRLQPWSVNHGGITELQVASESSLGGLQRQFLHTPIDAVLQ